MGMNRRTRRAIANGKHRPIPGLPPGLVAIEGVTVDGRPFVALLEPCNDPDCDGNHPGL
jgi:hypothetical protein